MANYLNGMNIQGLTEVIARIGGDLVDQWKTVAGVSLKSDRTYVTDSDLYADRELKNILPAFYPLPVFSEEDRKTDISRDCWLVDPIDGTAAFVSGIPTWAISVALIIKGEVRFGLIHFPVIGKMVHSEMPEGALNVTVPESPFQKEDFICVPSNVHKRYNIRFPGKIRSLGSCASQIYYVLTGKASFSVLGFPRIWDFAAGLPMLRKAGGEIFDLNGECLDFASLWAGKRRARQPLVAGHKQYIEQIVKMVELK